MSGWLALSVAACSTSAFAQQAPAPDIASLQQSSFEMDVTGAYDANVARSDESLAVERHIARADYILTPAANLVGVLPVGRETLFALVGVGYDFYSRNHILSREFVDVSAGVNAKLSSCNAKLTGGYDLHQTSLQDLIGGTTKIEQSSVKNLFDQESVGLDASCGRTTGFRPTASVSQTYTHNSDTARKVLDTRSFASSVGIGYVQPTFGSLQLYGQYTDISYPTPFIVPVIEGNPPTLGFLTLKNGFQVYSGGLRYDRAVGSRIEGTVSVAYTSLNPVSSLNPGFTGFTFEEDLTYHLSSRINLHARADRSTQPSNQIGAAYYVGEDYVLDGGYAVGSRIRLNLGAKQENRKYEVGSVAHENIITGERIEAVFGGAKLNLNRRFALSLDMRSEKRLANLSIYNYTDNRFGLKLSATF